ncbi:phosphotransacetylase [Candidatus Woesearchaeota archaeon]|nr:phosphotransacetylase [Candidatus Woesearchaeota archaeon]
MNILSMIHKQAMLSPMRIIFPEYDDLRIRRAVMKLAKLGLARPLVIMPRESVLPKTLRARIDVITMDPDAKRRYSDLLLRRRAHAGMTRKQADQKIKDPLWFGMMALADNQADALISSARYTTAQTMQAALRVIGARDKGQKVSSAFLMVAKKKPFIFADPSVQIDPNAKDLAHIAVASAQLASSLGLKPKVAMLSFSTHGSAAHPLVDKVVEATRVAKSIDPNLLIDGEVQLDAAIVPGVSKKKCPKSPLKGRANVLIFPDINAGNIGYKLVERFAGARAIGPIILNLEKQVNVLSRGCSVQDIVDLAAFTSVQVRGR